MRIETNTPDRKLLAQTISGQIHKPVHYNGVPGCTYSIGPVTVERDGAISTDSADAWETLMPFFEGHGWYEQAQIQLREHSEALTEPTPADLQAETPEHMDIRYRLSEFTVNGFTNFIRSLYAHQKLINAMLGGELLIDEETVLLLKETKPDTVEKAAQVVHQETGIGLNKGIDVMDGNLIVCIPFDSGTPNDRQHGARLLNTVADKAREAHHTGGKLIDPEDTAMKYFCHSWLIALGFGGPDFKALRAALLNHLPGYAAFRTAEKMDAHKAKFIERRRAEREEREGNAHEQN